MWKRYSWAEVDPDSLPWLANSEQPVASETPFIGELVDPADRHDAIRLGFDPNHTYYTLLAHEWNGHPVGARVLFEATEIAVELPGVETAQPGALSERPPCAAQADQMGSTG